MPSKMIELLTSKSNLIKKCLLVALPLFLILILLVTCSSNKLSGTYVMEEDINQSITFGDDDKVIFARGGINPLAHTETYEIKNGKIYFSNSGNAEFKKSGKSIFLDEIEYIKE